jgi:uncharacterized cupredoxin-like copper-binding protein
MQHRTTCAIAIAVVAAACNREKPAPPAAESAAPPTAQPAIPTAVTYTATNYAFDGPSETPAGPTQIRLVNHGTEPHHLVVIRIEEGRTFDSLQAALRKPEMPPRWAHLIGGPNGVSPSLESEANLALVAGNYAIVCFVPSRDGVPHLAKGMIRQLTVTPNDRPAAEPPADVTMDLTDYDFKLSAPLTAGRRVIQVTNGAQQIHEVVVVQLEKGKTVGDMAKWELSSRKGPAPGRYIGGMSPMAPGDKGQFTMTFEPGAYGFICFAPDMKDGKPHVLHGMTKDVTVS